MILKPSSCHCTMAVTHPVTMLSELLHADQKCSLAIRQLVDQFVFPLFLLIKT